MSAVPQEPTREAREEAQAQDRAQEKDKKKPDPHAAAQRLADSRERLRLYMLGGENREEARRRAGLLHADDEPRGEGSTWERLRGMPVIGVIVDVVASWWERHPLQPVVSLGKDIATHKVGPVIRRHPGAVMAGAFAIGVALVWLRPWRWLRKPAMAAGLLSQIGARTISQIPWELILAALTAVAHTREEPSESEHERAADALDKDSTEGLYEPAGEPLSTEADGAGAGDRGGDETMPRAAAAQQPEARMPQSAFP